MDQGPRRGLRQGKAYQSVLSTDPDASVLPSALSATHCTMPLWPCSVLARSRSASAIGHTLHAGRGRRGRLTRHSYHAGREHGWSMIVFMAHMCMCKETG